MIFTGCHCGVVAKPGIATGSRSNEYKARIRRNPWVKGSIDYKSALGQDKSLRPHFIIAASTLGRQDTHINEFDGCTLTVRYGNQNYYLLLVCVFRLLGKLNQQRLLRDPPF